MHRSTITSEHAYAPVDGRKLQHFVAWLLAFGSTRPPRARGLAPIAPKLRKGSYFPGFLEPRWMAEKALTAVIQEALCAWHLDTQRR